MRRQSRRSPGLWLATSLVAVTVLAAQQSTAPATPAAVEQTPAAPPATAVLSPDGRRSVWPSEDGRSVWSATRKTPGAPWDPAARLLTIRGIVRNLVFSPDSSKLAFENPRSMTGGRAGGAAPAPQDTWAFIVVFDIGKRTIAYVDPQFGIDSAPVWSGDSREITFMRKFGDLPATKQTRPVPEVRTWTAPTSKPGDVFSLSSALGVPFVYAPVASGDRRSLAYVTREGVNRNIYFLRLGAPAKLIVNFPGDDGQELTTPAVSNTGGAVAFVRGATSNPTSLPDPPEAEVWIVSTKGGVPQRLGPGLAPAFSADDTQLVWSSGGGAQFRASLTWSGGSLASVGKAEKVPATPPPAPELRGLFSPDAKKVASRTQTGISIYDIASKSSWTVPDSAGAEAVMLWSPDNRYLAFRKNATGLTGSAGINGYRFNGVPVASEPFSVWVVDVAGSTSTQVFKASPGMGSVQTGAMFWSDDDRIAFQWEGDGWQHYYSVPATGGAPTLMTRGDGDVEFVEQSLDRKHLIVTSNIGDLGRRHISIVDFNGGTIAIVRQGAASQWSPVQLADGRLAYLEATHAMPPTVMIREREGSTTAAGLPKLPASSPASKFVEPMLVEFPALDGKTAFGQLFVPAQPSGCGIIFAHGGIRRQMLPGFHYMDAYTHLYELNQYLVSRGCVVLSVEYRSSIMRGYAFRNAPGWGHAGASEMLDVAGGAKYLLARADVDAKRGIGIHGLSWGGYITAQALARYPELFSVGFDMAGVHTSNDAAGVPHSAMAFLDQWKAPILLAQGDDDRNVVFTEGIKLTRELLKRPNVRLVQRVFPNETHDLYLTFEHLVTIYQEGADFLLAKVGK
jgi:dipeptidyl aminopeptidase/acylaminoacyl peptidase